ncbi:FliM/FliN family flagellar motor switch protein [Parvularcula oceani]|uniref:FliM/FliN family flagellar motor switch protein n=1 Tax=Parvularcula oceani TaxID=1247963 RepID=UPI000567EA2C|nr:FliM/FliN family flagellar motor switch protein [Parvularcula oceani]
MSEAVATQDAIPAALEGLPLTLTIRIGTARRTVAEVTQLAEGSLLALDARVDEPLDICIGDRVVARGELTESEDGGLAVKLTEIEG